MINSSYLSELTARFDHIQANHDPSRFNAEDPKMM